MTLIGVKYNDTKVEFTWRRSDGETISTILKEKASWPIVVDQPLPLVEAWFKSRYGDLLANFLWNLNK